jgi:hypothetical protein
VVHFRGDDRVTLLEDEEPRVHLGSCEDSDGQQQARLGDVLDFAVHGAPHCHTL